jgi:hypothetical protein
MERQCDHRIRAGMAVSIISVCKALIWRNKKKVVWICHKVKFLQAALWCLTTVRRGRLFKIDLSQTWSLSGRRCRLEVYGCVPAGAETFCEAGGSEGITIACNVAGHRAANY